jgi:hypothetical protein
MMGTTAPGPVTKIVPVGLTIVMVGALAVAGVPRAAVANITIARNLIHRAFMPFLLQILQRCEHYLRCGASARDSNRIVKLKVPSVVLLELSRGDQSTPSVFVDVTAPPRRSERS